MEIQEHQGLLPIAAIEQALLDAQRNGVPPHEIRQLSRKLVGDAMKAVAVSSSNKVINLRGGTVSATESEKPTRAPLQDRKTCSICGKTGLRRIEYHLFATHKLHPDGTPVIPKPRGRPRPAAPKERSDHNQPSGQEQGDFLTS